MGVKYCCVYGCMNNAKMKNLSFYKLPKKNSERLKKWLDTIGREDLIDKEKPSSYCVCSIHFEEKMYINKRLISDAVPSLNLPNQPESSNSPTSNVMKKNKECQVDFTKVTKIVHIPKNISATNASKAVQTEYFLPLTCVTESLPLNTSSKYPNSLNASVATQTSAICGFQFTVKPEKPLFTPSSKPVTQPVCVQTTKNLNENSPRKIKMRAELKECREKIRKLEKTCKKRKSDTVFTDEESENKRTKTNVMKSEKCTVNAQNKFIEKFIKWQKELQFKYKGNRYATKFRLFCLNIYLSSPQTYRFLEQSFVMPSVRTLQKIKMNFSTGVDDNLMKILSRRLKGMPQNSKYCILCLDEMVLRKKLYYDIKNDEVIGFHEIDGKKSKEIAGNAFVVMLRGCIQNYKQPLGYAFTATNKNYIELSNWVDETIKRLFDSGFEVCAVVSDQGSNFVNFAKSKGVTVENPFFTVNGKRVFYIFDVPHLVKCIRNNLLMCNFVFDGNEVASWSHVEHFYKIDKDKNIRMAPKLTDAHINPNSFQRMKVRYATQIFSHTVAAGMSTNIELGHLPSNAQGTVNFILKMNNVFDIMNSSKIQDSNKYKKAFSGAAYQLECLKNALNMFKNIKVNKSGSGKDITTKIQTFNSFQMSITVILQLFAYFSSIGLKFIFTRRLNQDPVENLFGTIRQQGGNSREPTPIQFKRAFSKLVIGCLLNNTDLSNCENDLDKFLLCKDDLNPNFLFAKPTTVMQSESPLVVGTTDYRFDLPTQNAFNYVCGYLLKKCSHEHECPDLKFYLEKNETTVVEEHQLFIKFKAYNKSKVFGNLIVPPEHFVNYMESYEEKFLNEFENTVIHPGLGKHIVNIIETNEQKHPCPCFPSKYLTRLFVRMRIYYTIKFINRKLKNTSVKTPSFLNIRHL